VHLLAAALDVAVSTRASWLLLFAGPAAWFAQQQFLDWLRPVACARDAWLMPAIALAFVAALALAGALSAQRLRRGTSPTTASRFLAVLAAAMPLLFATALLWQLAATLYYTPCER
jgi:hypothetical protein